MKPVRALFFDLDGTLLDGSGFGEAVARTCSRIAATRPGLSAERLLTANNTVWESYWPEVEQEWTLGVLDGTTVSLEAWRRTLLACGSDDEGLARLALDTLSVQARGANRLFDDVQEILDRLVGRLPLALITNGAADTQREKLRALGIEDHFDAIIVSGEHGVAKPDPAIFQIALDNLGVGPERAWHVGDSLEADIAGARDAGLTAVWLNRNGAARSPEHPEPHVEIRSLTELLEYIEP